MADRITKEQRSLIMSHIHSDSTKPELKLRKALWSKGFRYRVNQRRMPGTPDIVLAKYHTAIFVHGCFWHGHNGCSFSHIPQSNVDYWSSKISRNQQRDQEVWRQLEAKGWSVIIVWECQLKKAALDETIARVEAEILRNGDQYRQEQEERKASRDAYLQERKAKKEREAALKAELLKK